MARRLNMALFMVLMTTAAFQMQSSEAQTTHVVGGGIGWTIPPAGAVAYTTWAATQNFTVGDVLVFNFQTNAHNVAEVTQSAFDGCIATNPISLSTTGPTNITLNSTGTHHFICTVGTHCNIGQKLAINVSAAASTPPPAAAPSTPPPAAAPTTPPPAAAPTTPPPAAAPTTPPPAAAPQPATPTPSTTDTPPTPSASSPGGVTSPPPPSASSPGGVTSPPPPSGSPPAFAVAALPITFLSVALAFLY